VSERVEADLKVVKCPRLRLMSQAAPGHFGACSGRDTFRLSLFGSPLGLAGLACWLGLPLPSLRAGMKKGKGRMEHGMYEGTNPP
jgi:hypothetical protein